MKRLIAVILSLLLMSAGFAVSAAAEDPVISIMFGGGTPLSIDPALNSAAAGGNILKLGHVGLLSYQPTDDGDVLMPELAESYTVSEDACTYVFTLREGLKWSDGSDFTVSELKASWDRAAAPELGADYGFMYDVVERNADGSLCIEADDAARTFTVELIAPTPYFTDLCAFYTFFPVKVELADDEGIWATNPDTFIGLGAFRMTKYAVDDVISFEKNEYYWNADAVQLGGVNCYLSEDNVAILTAYENDTVMFIDSIDPTEYPRIDATYPGELIFGPYVGTYYVLFNVHKDYSPAGKQLTVHEQSSARFAIGQMVNRFDLVEYILQGGQIPAVGFYPVNLQDGLNSNVREADEYGTWYTGTATPSDVNPNFTVDEVEACQTLIDLGYAYTGTIEGGDIQFTDFPPVEFAFNNSGANKLIIEYVQEIWNKFGITATINTEAWATLQQKLKDGDAEAAHMGWLADFNDCINFLEIVISASGNNYPRLGKDVGDYKRASEVTEGAGMGAHWGIDGDQTWAEAFDALVEQIRVTSDPVERAKLCADAEKVLMSSGGVAPLYYYTHPYMQKLNLKGVMALPIGGIIFTYAYVD
ncbi:MAG: peptide ABC transporter substrate-binding protein [Clostridia bacterium]|nr:peptide ABC transporter substrate-binding protein [Clostridia bacterium]